MRANSTTGRIIGALARTTPQTSSYPDMGFRRNSTAGRIIGALARSKTSDIKPNYLSKYDVYLARELDYEYSSHRTLIEWLPWLQIASACFWRKLGTASTKLLKLLGRIPLLVWRFWMRPTGTTSYVRARLYRYLRIAIPIGAMVLLSLHTVINVVPALSALLAFAVILQLLVTSSRIHSRFPIIIFFLTVILVTEIISIHFANMAPIHSVTFSWSGIHIKYTIISNQFPPYPPFVMRTIAHKSYYFSWGLIFLLCSLPTAAITFAVKRPLARRRSVGESSSVPSSQRATKSGTSNGD